MSWNRSEEKGKRKKEGGRSREEVRGFFRTRFSFPVLAGIVAILAVAFALCCVFRSDERGYDDDVDEGVRRAAGIAEHKAARGTRSNGHAESRKQTADLPLAATQTIAQIERALAARKVATNTFVMLEKPLLEDPTDQLYFDVFLRELGDPPPMTPFLPEKDEIEAVKNLNRQLAVSDEDDEAHVFAKETVNLVKKELANFIEQGGTINQFFEYYCGKLERAYEMKKIAMRELEKASDTLDSEGAAEFLKTVNAKLEAEGLAPLEYNSRQIMSISEN